MASSGSNRREQLRALQEAQARQRRNRRIIGIVAAAVALYLLRNRKTRFGLHLPLHPSSPRPGTVPRMAHGLRLRSW